MKDLKLNIGHDLNFDGLDFSWVEESPAVAQRIKIRLLTILAEYKWSYTVGVDWFDEIFSTEVPHTRKNGVIRTTISDTEGVSAIRTFEFGLDRNNKTARVSFVCGTIYEDTVSGYLTQLSTLNGGS